MWLRKAFLGWGRWGVEKPGWLKIIDNTDNSGFILRGWLLQKKFGTDYVRNRWRCFVDSSCTYKERMLFAVSAAALVPVSTEEGYEFLFCMSWNVLFLHWRQQVRLLHFEWQIAWFLQLLISVIICKEILSCVVFLGYKKYFFPLFLTLKRRKS